MIVSVVAMFGVRGEVGEHGTKLVSQLLMEMDAIASLATVIPTIGDVSGSADPSSILFMAATNAPEVSYCSCLCRYMCMHVL